MCRGRVGKFKNHRRDVFFIFYAMTDLDFFSIYNVHATSPPSCVNNERSLSVMFYTCQTVFGFIKQIIAQFPVIHMHKLQTLKYLRHCREQPQANTSLHRV